MKRQFLITTVAIMAALTLVSAIVVALVINQHMYPQDALHQTSNLAVRGIVTSIEQYHASYAFGYYHIFRFWIKLNITEIVWTNYEYISDVDISILSDDSINVGYDNLDNPQLVIGQKIECKGFYWSFPTDSPYIFILTISPSINESYLKPQT